MAKNKNELTDWELGQELIKAYDCLCEVQAEIAQRPDLQNTVRLAANMIVIEFEKLKSHEFGLGMFENLLQG
jgi:hypothetical protein